MCTNLFKFEEKSKYGSMGKIHEDNLPKMSACTCVCIHIYVLVI